MKDDMKLDGFYQTLDEDIYYYPDFTFICDETRLHIDIEIDEPYSLPDKKPIHYVGIDEWQNESF